MVQEDRMPASKEGKDQQSYPGMTPITTTKTNGHSNVEEGKLMGPQPCPPTLYLNVL